MKLYFSRGACSIAPHIVLYDLGLPFEAIKVDLATKKAVNGDDLWAVNPKGYVPTLVLDDGQVLTEVGVILQYLADIKPETALAPRFGTMERYRLMEWLTFLGTEVHKAFAPLFHKDATDERKEAARQQVGKRFSYIEKGLKPGAYMMGDDYTVVDAYMFVLLRWARYTSIDIAQWPTLAAYLQRLYERPAVKAMLAAEGIK